MCRAITQPMGLALHAVNLGSILSIPYGPQVLSRITTECRSRPCSLVCSPKKTILFQAAQLKIVVSSISYINYSSTMPSNQVPYTLSQCPSSTEDNFSVPIAFGCLFILSYVSSYPIQERNHSPCLSFSFKLHLA